MGNFGSRLVTGALQIIASSGTTASLPPQPLSCSIFFNQGEGVFSVHGSSGDMYTQVGGAVANSISGGTPPYTATITTNGDPSGKLSIVPVPGDGSGHVTIGYSGFSLNEVEICYLQMNVSDAAHDSASDRYPENPGEAIAIKRTS